MGNGRATPSCLPSQPLPVPGPCQRARRLCEASREPEGPAAALRLRLSRGSSGPARGGVGETIGNAGKGGVQGWNEGRGLLTYSRFPCPF